MKLLIDAGNTRVKLGWVLPDGSRESQAGAYAHDEIGRALPQWLRGLPEPPRAALGVNVAGAALGEAITDLCGTVGCAVQWQRSPDAAFGMRNGYRQPAQLGADRWLALLGLWASPRHGRAAEPKTVQVLASFGTATTVDTVSGDGRFEGGLILPGLELMLRSLASGTANLPLATGAPASFPTDTHEAITTGVLAAQAGAILRQLLTARDRFPRQRLQLAVSGGAWPRIQPELTRLLALADVAIAPRFVDNPVLDGLAVMALSAD